MTMTEWDIVEEAIHLVSRGVSVKDAAKRLRVDREWLNVRVTSHKEPMTAAEVKALRRAMASQQDQRDTTGRVLGDPPPGRSALDQRQHHAP